MTVYNAVKEVGREANNIDLQRIGCAVQNKAFRNNVKYTKVKQVEGEATFYVINYPDEFSRFIYEEIDKYFLRKEHDEIILTELKIEQAVKAAPSLKPKRKRIQRGGGK